MHLISVYIDRKLNDTKENILRIGRRVILVMLITLNGCTYLPFIHRIKPAQNTPQDQSRIMAYYVVHNAPDHLAVVVKYSYDGKEGKAVSIGAITRKDGRSDGHWAYRPDPVLPGEHWAHILIGMSDSASSAYDSDEIEFSMYINKGAEFVNTGVPFRKHWRRLEPPQPMPWGLGDGVWRLCSRRLGRLPPETLKLSRVCSKKLT